MELTLPHTDIKPTIRLREVFQEKAFWLLILIIALFFIRPLLFGESFFLRDIYKYFLPQTRLLQEFIASGEWPLWDQYLHGGYPYLGAPGNAVVYPFNVLYFFFSFITAFNLIIILHFFLCAASAYTFARVIGFSPISAMVVGIAYTFCGLTLSQVNLLHAFFSSAYLPLLFLWWHLFLVRKQQRWFVLAVLTNGLRLLLVVPELYIIGMLLLAGWTYWYPYPSCRARSKILAWVLLNVFAFGVAAIQLVPTLELMTQSSRGEGLSYRMFTFWSLPVRRLPELIFPQFMGYVNRLAASDYWGRGIDEDTPMTLILSIYWGGTFLFLAMAAGLSTHSNPVFPKRLRRFLFLTAVLSGLLALGRALPFFKLIYLYVPFINIFRFPVKFLLFSIFPLALLAGYTVERHWGRWGDSQGWHPSRRLLTGLWSGTAFLLISVVLWAYFPAFSEQFHRIFFRHPGNDVSQQGLFRAFVHALGFWTLLTLLYHHRSQTKTSWQPAVLCGILALDLLIAGKPLNPTVAREFYTTIPPAATLVQHYLHKGRLYRTDVPRNPILRVPDDRIVWGSRWNLDVLEEYSAAFYQIPVIFHPDFDSLANFRVMALRSILERVPWPQKVPLLSAGNVTTVVTDAKLSVPGLRHIAVIPNQSNLVFHLFQNKKALGQVQFVRSWEYAESDNAAEQAMLRHGFDPGRHVVLQRNDASSTSFWFSEIPRDKSLSQALPKDAASSQAADIQNLQTTSSAITFSLDAPCDGYVVFPIPYYPGWKATVDGKRVPIVRANFAFSAIFAPHGHYHIRLFYAPFSVMLGSGLSLIFLGVLAIAGLTGTIRKIL